MSRNVRGAQAWSFGTFVAQGKGKMLGCAWKRAVHASWLAKLADGIDRRNAYRLKSGIINHVLVRDPDGVRLRDLGLGTVGLRYRGGASLHIPWKDLTDDAREVVLDLVRARAERLAASRVEI
jgi:hypothetical protein